MKPHLILTFFLVAAATVAVVLAYPSHHDSTDLESDNRKVVSRTRRDLAGIFDSIANGMDGLMSGMKKMSDSVMQAFDNVFSANNLKAITDGFSQFKNGVKESIGGVFGSEGSLAKGFKKIGDKVSGAFKGGKGGDENAAQKDPPAGDVPEEETT